VLRIDLNHLLMQALQGEVIAKVINVANVVLVVLLAYSLADLTWRLMPAPEMESLPPIVSSKASNQIPERAFNIARFHLFGKKQVQANKQLATAPMRETKLNLTLHGVVASDQPAFSGAIISAPGKNERFYSVETEVAGGAVLKEVHPDHVVLLRNGQYETLRLPEQTLGQIQGNKAVPKAVNKARVASAQPKVSLREYRDTLVRNPQELAGMVSIAPYKEAGRVVGYTVKPGRDKAIFGQLGLQAGDVVTSVNGIKLNNPAKGLSVLRTLTGNKEVQLEIRRNGAPQSLTVNMNQ